jgi:hypothetical protein
MLFGKVPRRRADRDADDVAQVADAISLGAVSRGRSTSPATRSRA